MDILIVTKTLDTNKVNHSFTISDIQNVDYLSLLNEITQNLQDNFLILNTIDGIIAIRASEISWIKIIVKDLLSKEPMEISSDI